MTVDPRLLAVFGFGIEDVESRHDDYKLTLAASAADSKRRQHGGASGRSRPRCERQADLPNVGR
ncbi:hypothetical protein [Duganella sp. BJB1802]|uniref:hypothetical protein n=1 Tax=Duganella sp. BJB1802 TaxID=2744575 RepID=UPI001E3EB372|nr:hypothetical protein [Duganella sp. BJB1802]